MFYLAVLHKNEQERKPEKADGLSEAIEHTGARSQGKNQVSWILDEIFKAI